MHHSRHSQSSAPRPDASSACAWRATATGSSSNDASVACCSSTRRSTTRHRPAPSRDHPQQPAYLKRIRERRVGVEPLSDPCVDPDRPRAADPPADQIVAAVSSCGHLATRASIGPRHRATPLSSAVSYQPGARSLRGKLSAERAALPGSTSSRNPLINATAPSSSPSRSAACTASTACPRHRPSVWHHVWVGRQAVGDVELNTWRAAQHAKTETPRRACDAMCVKDERMRADLEVRLFAPGDHSEATDRGEPQDPLGLLHQRQHRRLGNHLPLTRPPRHLGRAGLPRPQRADQQLTRRLEFPLDALEPLVTAREPSAARPGPRPMASAMSRTATASLTCSSAPART